MSFTKLSENYEKLNLTDIIINYLINSIMNYLFPGKSFTGGESNGDGRIKMGAGDVSDGVNKNHDCKSPDHGYSGERHNFIVIQINNDRRTSGEYKEIRPQNLRH